MAELNQSLDGGRTRAYHEESHVELAVVDRSGRLQIPKEYLEALGLKEKNKVKVELDGNRIILVSPEEH